MCSGLPSAKCGTLHTCVDAPEVYSCQHVQDRCFTCFSGILAGDKEKAEPTHGLFLYSPAGEFVCVIIKRVGSATGLQPFDEIRQINGVLADESFFDQFDKMKTQAMDFKLSVWREGVEHKVETVRT